MLFFQSFIDTTSSFLITLWRACLYIHLLFLYVLSTGFKRNKERVYFAFCCRFASNEPIFYYNLVLTKSLHAPLNRWRWTERCSNSIRYHQNILPQDLIQTLYVRRTLQAQMSIIKNEDHYCDNRKRPLFTSNTTSRCPFVTNWNTNNEQGYRKELCPCSRLVILVNCSWQTS